MAFVAPVLGFMPKYHNSFIPTTNSTEMTVHLSVYQVVATAGKMGIWGPSLGAHLFLLSTDALRTGWGAHMQDLTTSGIWTAEKLLSWYQHLGDGGSSTGF